VPKEILTGTHPGIEAVPVRVGPSAGAEFNLVRAFLIPKACFKLEDAHFKFDSSFVVPDGFDIAPLKTLLDKHPGTKLSIFGHADPTGDDTYNKTLSGRRASAVFGLLTRDVAMWDKLHDHAAGGDNWKPEAEQTMRATTGLPPGTARATLTKAYMDHLCTVRDAQGQPAGTVELTKDDFLARGKGKDGKGDLQGCSEFNPLMIFSKSEKALLDQPANRPKRNEENQVNRRVMVLLFRPGSQVDPNKWPCPTVEEGIAKCLKRFHSDGEKRRSNQGDRREFKDTKDTFACRFYDRISNSSPCEIPVPPPPPPTIDFVKIETSVFAAPPLIPVFFDDHDDFCPRIQEHAKIHVRINNLLPGAAATVRIDIGRLTNRPDNAATADVDESFTLVARLDQNVVGGANPLPVEVEWNGNSTVAVPQEFSNRTTLNVNSGAAINIPMQAIASGQPATHGLYVIDQIVLLQSGVEVDKERLTGVDMSVPFLVNLQFNGNWPGDLTTFGLSPFRTQIEEALRRFGGRDYMIRDATVTNRINARFIIDPAITNAQSVTVSVGGLGTGPFGSTPFGPAPLSDNIYAFHDGTRANISVFPRRFIVFNTAAGAIGPGDQATFQAVYGPVGVSAAQTPAAPGTATARSVTGGVVTGACNATDAGNITLVFDDDGMATVTTTNPALVPPARAADIQRALRAFVRMIGNTINHETAHGFGVVSEVRANNSLTISGTTVTSPLNGDSGAHNRVTNNTNIVDDGGTRAFARRIENTGIQQRFNATNVRYLRDVIPFDRTNH
jgi:hypothetical protein